MMSLQAIEEGDKHPPDGSLSLITDLLLGLKSITLHCVGDLTSTNGMFQSQYGVRQCLQED